MATAPISDGQLQKLRNRFFVIRHGQSLSNVKDIVVTNPDIGVKEYGLTDVGKEQAAQAAVKLSTDVLSDEDKLSEKLLVYCSDFLRVKQTAEIIHGKLSVTAPLQTDEGLRERWLGELDMGPDSVVHDMWRRDSEDPTQKYKGMESVMEMVLRLSRVVQSLDRKFENKIILLVSHGDPCQALHAVFSGIDPKDFRKQGNYLNCEIRELVDTV